MVEPRGHKRCTGVSSRPDVYCAAFDGRTIQDLRQRLTTWRPHQQTAAAEAAAAGPEHLSWCYSPDSFAWCVPLTSGPFRRTDGRFRNPWLAEPQTLWSSDPDFQYFKQISAYFFVLKKQQHSGSICPVRTGPFSGARSRSSPLFILKELSFLSSRILTNFNRHQVFPFSYLFRVPALLNAVMGLESLGLDGTAT